MLVVIRVAERCHIEKHEQDVRAGHQCDFFLAKNGKEE